MNELEGDREALEHIARALEGRVLAGPGALAPAEARPQPDASLALTPEGLAVLLESMPAAIGILAGGRLVHINTAFAYAFGYRTPAELIEAGGLEAGGLRAILPNAAPLTQGNGLERSAPIEALTRSRRKLKVAFALTALDGDVKLLRLIDQTSLEQETLAAPPVNGAEPQTANGAEPQTANGAEPQTANGAEPRTVNGASAPIEAVKLDADASSRLEFLANVSHEVRTPLNSIIGFAELMAQERFGPIGSARYKGYVDDIHQSGLYALSLLNDLLDISKIEAGKFELNFTAVEVPELVEDCVGSLQPLAKRARIVLRTSLQPELPTVVADPRRLKQILLNLLTNAIKFTKEGGQVIVSGGMIDGELRLRVRDTGVGMTKDEIAFAMQPFNQLDTAPRRQMGTGLGLPVTKALVDANRARLVLTSEPGVGTSADVIFPADRLFNA
jgi:signal transduction histidine kinase